MRNISDKIVDKLGTHILCSKTFLRISYFLRGIDEKYGGAGQATDDNIIRRMRFAYWITKTHSEYVTLTAIPLLQLFRQRTLLSLYTYFVCVVYVRTLCKEKDQPNLYLKSQLVLRSERTPCRL